MISELAVPAAGWNYNLEDILGLVLVGSVVCAYSLMFAIARKPRRGWTLTAIFSFAVTAALIAASPPAARVADAAHAGPAGHGVSLLSRPGGKGHER